MVVCIGVQRHFAKLNLEMTSARRQTLPELQAVLHLKLFFYDLVHGVLKALGREPFQVTVDTTVVLGQHALGLVDTFLLKEVILVVVDKLLALVALGGFPPCEILAVRIRFAFIV